MSVAAASATAADTVVITAECRGCGACLLTCPEHAIRPVPASGVPAHGASAEAGPAHLVVLDELCTRCGECIEVCPADAVAEGPGQSNPVAEGPGQSNPVAEYLGQSNARDPNPCDSEVIA